MKSKGLIWFLGAAGAVALAVLFYLLSNPLEEPRRALFREGWELCEVGDKCVAVDAPCGEWKPVNEKYEDDAAAYYRHLITVVEKGEMVCMESFVGGTKPNAWCVSGACTLAQ